MVIYELFVRNFSEDGTFQAVEAGLDDIVALGADTLWLLPVHPSGRARSQGSHGSPFAVRDHLAVHPEHGTMEDFKRLVRSCHDKGMRLVLDWVANHTAWDHPWIVAHPERHSRDRAGIIIHPPGTSWTDVADLDYANDDVWRFMQGAMRFWVEEVGVDGFRCDYAEGLPKAFWAETVPMLKQVNPALILLAKAGPPWLAEVGMTHFLSQDVLAALKRVFAQGASAQSLAEAFSKEPSWMGAPSCRVRCSTTHDETAWDAAPPVLFGGLNAAQCAQAIAHVLPGTPLLYSGQEVGSAQALSLVERTPIDWSTHPEMRLWTRTLLRARTSHPALVSGDVAFSGTDEVIVVHRTCEKGGSNAACLVANVTDKPVRVEVDLGTGIEARDVWTGRLAEGVQDLDAHEVRLFVSGVG